MKFPIAIKNLSTVVKDGEVQQAIASCQRQLSEEFAEHWGLDANLSFLSRKATVPATSWLVGIYDDADQAGALGYHDLTCSGMPLGKVFAGTTIRYGGEWTVTLSHELLEIVADPNINLGAFDEATGCWYAYEVCDAVEADALGYLIDGIRVSDFVLPGWFEPMYVAKGERFAFKSKVGGPFALMPGGYISFLDVRSGRGWQQIEARTGAGPRIAEHRFHHRPRVGSRRERRQLPTKHWLRSTAK